MKKLKLLSYFYSLLLMIALSAIPSRAIDVIVGTGTESATGYPFNGGWGGNKTQMIYTAAEISAAGGITGFINSASFNIVENTATDNELINFTLKIQPTALTSMTAFVSDGWVDAFSGTFDLSTTPGWQAIPFQAPFFWDGTSNILVEVCWAVGTTYRGGTTEIAATETNADYVWETQQDSQTSCAGITNTGYAAFTVRPNILFGLTPADIPYITAGPSMINFNYIPAEGFSNPQTIQIGGDNLDPASGNLTITPPFGFQISSNNGTTWSSDPLTVAYVGNPIATPISLMVRFAPQEEIAYTGALTVTGGSATANVNLSGTAILTYCTPVVSSTTGWDIANINILNVNNTSQVITPVSPNPASTLTYTDFRDAQPAINAQAGTIIPYSFNVIQSSEWGYSGTFKVWIDLNRNGIIDPVAELVSTVNVPYEYPNVTGLFNGTMTIPPNAVVGQNTLIRFMMSSNSGSTPCNVGAYANGEAEDYWINFSAPSPFIVANPKVKNFGVVPAGTSTLATDITIEAGSLTPATGNLIVTPTPNYAVSIDGGTTWSTTAVNIPYTNGGSNLTPSIVKVRFNSPSALGLNFGGVLTINGANAPAPAIVSLIGNNMQTYALSSVSLGSVEDTIDIAKVTLANLAFGEANVTPITERPTAINKYTDNRLAAPVITFNAGGTYQYTVNTYTTGTAMPLCSLRVYADYNANGDFNGASELVANVAIPATNNGVYTGSFMVPTDTNIVKTNALNHPRMRFVLSTYQFNSSNDTTYTVGETEDYRMIIQPALPMTFVSVAATQVGKDIINAGYENEKIIRTKINTNNAGNPISINSIVFNTNGSVPVSTITAAKVFFTKDTATFNTNTQIGNALIEPNGSMTFASATPTYLAAGDNYVWLAYSVSATAALDAVLDAELTGLYLSDAPTVNKISTPIAPEGFSLVNQLKFDGTFPTANGNTFPYNGWTSILTAGTDANWSTVITGNNPYTTPHSAPAMAEFNAYNFNAGNNAALVTPPFARTGAEESNIISLWLHRQTNSTSGPGSTFKVWMNTEPNMTGAVQLNVNGYTDVNTINVRIDQGAITVPEAGWYQYSYTIPETFTGETNYVLFEGISDWWNNIHLDDIKIGNDAYMAVAKIDTLGTGNNSFAVPSTNNLVNAFNVKTVASNNPLTLSNVKFTPEGTTNVAAIANAKVWYLGNTASFAPETNVLFGTVATIVAGQNTVVRTANSDAITLSEGNNYFAITYDVVPTAVGGTIVDCKLNSVTYARGEITTEKVITNGNTWGTHEIKLPMSGTYTVGGTPLTTRWYPTLDAAANELSSLGINGNTDIAIAGNQTFTAAQSPIFAGINNVGGNYTVTIYPKDAPRTITGEMAGTGLGVLTFIGTDRVVIDGRVNKQGTQKGLTIINNALGFNVRYANADEYGISENFTIKFVNFKGSATSNDANATGVVFAGKDINNITLSNNTFDRISNGIYIQGIDTVKIQTVTINNNLFGNSAQADRLRRVGVRIANTNEVTINNNMFTGLGNDNTDYMDRIEGIRIISGVDGATIKDNKMSDFVYKYNWSSPVYGINISTNTNINNINIFNNAISNFNVYGYSYGGEYSLFNYAPIGIRIAGGNTVKVINNTVNFDGSYFGTTNRAISACFAVASPSTGSIANLTVRNNIFKNTLTNNNTQTESYSIYAAAGTTFLDINNNNYFVSGLRGKLAYLGTDKLTLLDWQTATTQDAGSVSTKVTFASATDMHLSGGSACNVLLNCPLADEVIFDMDGNERAATTKMGVDEVFADLEITGQPVSEVTKCVTLGVNNTIEIPVGTFSVSAYSDGYARTFSVSDLEYSWTKNGEAIVGNSAPLQVVFNGATLPEINDVYEATVVSLGQSFNSTTLMLSEGPAIYTLSGSGSLCPNATVGVGFTLSNSQLGVSYQLRLGDTLAVGTPLLGTGEALTFANVTGIGTYKVLAFNTANPTCVATMGGSATISSLPVATAFTVIGGGTGSGPFAIGLNSSELGVVYKLYRDNILLDAVTAYGTGSPVSFGTYTQAGTYTAKGIRGTCETMMTGNAVIIVPAGGYTVSGTIKYANTAQTAMNNCVVIIKSGTTEVGRDTTDATGNYSVTNLENGAYTIEVLTTKAHGGINGLDVSLLRQRIGNTATFTPLQMLAGDINGNGSINGLDVAPLRLKIANTATPQWLVPNYIFYPKTITVDGADSVLDIQSLCGGDVNKSFTPSGN